MNKNNLSSDVFKKKTSLSHFLLIMRTTIILLFSCVFISLAESGYTQNAKVTINKSNVNLKEVLNEIENQTDYLFIYNNEVNTNRDVSVNTNDESVRNVLTDVFQNTDIHFEMEGNHIILSHIERVKSKEDISRTAIVQQEGKTVTGTILDTNGEPIIGANIIEKGTSNGTVTDYDGNFTLNVSDDAVLRISYIGYLEQEIGTEGRNKIDVQLVEDTQALDEVVVVGYGSLKQKEVTGSLVSVNLENIPKTGASSISQLLSAQASGLTTIPQSAQPGGKVKLQIRGAATGRTPLIVVDGLPISDFYNVSAGVYGAGETESILSSLNPNDIESIDILKDASATSIYGSKGAGGVILITTKRGGKEGMNVEFSANIGQAQVYGLPKLLDATGFMNEKNRTDREKFMYENQIEPYGEKKWSDFGNYKETYKPEDFSKWENNAGTDWINEITRNALLQNYRLSISGSSKSTSYYTSLGYYGQEGVLQNNNYNKITGQFNFDYNLSKKIKIGFTLNINRTKIDNLPLQSGYAENSDIIRSALYYPPNISIRDESGKYNLNRFAPYLSNPVSLLDITSKTKNDRLIGSGTIAYKITPDIKIRGMAGTDITYSQAYSYLPSTTIIGERYNGRADKSLGEKNDYQTQLFLDYNKILKMDHSIKLLLGAEYIKREREGFRSTNTDFITDNFLWYNLGLGAGYPSVGSYGNSSETIGYIGRISYSYMNRYFLTSNLRADGSSNFSKNHQWGYFPGVSIGWDLAQEPFMIKTRHLIDQIKIRAGYGQTGNDNIGSAFANYFVPGDKTMFGNTINASITLGGLGNPDLKWETQTDFNVGVDYSFLNGRLHGSLEYFNRVISDILGWKRLSSASEVTGISANMDSEKQTYGFEFSVNSLNIKRKKFKWHSNLYFTYYRDRWLKRDDSWNPDINSSEKQFFGELWFHLTDGIVQPGEELPYTNKPIPGTVKIKDIDGYLKDENGHIEVDENGIPKRSGKPDGRIDNADLVKIGINTPFTVGFSNRIEIYQFDLNFILHSMFNRWKINSTKHLLTDSYWMKDGLNQSPDIKHRWNSDNQDGYLPSSLQGQSSFGVGDFYLEKAWFIRLKNIELGYTPKIKKYGLNKVRFFISLENPLIITPYKGMDPETETRQAAYPNQRSMQVGFNLKF